MSEPVTFALTPLDDAKLAVSLHRMVAERLRLYALFSIMWGLSHGPTVWLVAEPPSAWMWAALAAFLVVCIVALLAIRRALHVHALNAIGVTLGLWQIAVVTLTARHTGEPAFFWITPLVMAFAGALVLHREWLLAYLAVASGVALTVGHLRDHALSTDLLLLICASVTSVLLHEVGKRNIVRIETLRHNDEQQRAALEQALARLQQQLADRERAEAERAKAQAEGERLREQLMHAQKMDAIGTLAGGFAHDMNNVLGGILGIAELLREEVPAQFHGDVDEILESSRRGADLTRNLLGFARRGKYRKDRVDIRLVVDDLLRLLTRTLPKGVEFVTEIETPSPLVEGDPALLTQALLNLCLNAADAMRGVGRITIAAGSLAIDDERGVALGVQPGRYVAVRVTDTGCGMDAETQRRAFEPFFTTKHVGRGTGLGLPMVYGTVHSYGGAVEIASTVGVGTTVTLYLPPFTREIAEGSAARAKRPSTAGSGTILVVDDDVHVRRLARRILGAKGYQVIEAGDGQEAVACFAGRDDIGLVLLDMSMPVMSGGECFRAIRERDPHARVLLVSGYTLEEDARRCLSEGAIGFVDKPYTVESLSRAVAHALRDEPASAET